MSEIYQYPVNSLFGIVPVKMDIEVIPADIPRQMTLGWAMYESIGVGMVNNQAISGLNMRNLTPLQKLAYALLHAGKLSGWMLKRLYKSGLGFQANKLFKAFVRSGYPISIDLDTLEKWHLESVTLSELKQDTPEFDGHTTQYSLTIKHYNKEDELTFRIHL